MNRMVLNNAYGLLKKNKFLRFYQKKMSHFSGSFGIPIQFEPNPSSKLFQPFLSELNSSSGGILISGTSPAPNLPRAAAWLVLESCALHGLEGLLPHG